MFYKLFFLQVPLTTWEKKVRRDDNFTRTKPNPGKLDSLEDDEEWVWKQSAGSQEKDAENDQARRAQMLMISRRPKLVAGGARLEEDHDDRAGSVLADHVAAEVPAAWPHPRWLRLQRRRRKVSSEHELYYYVMGASVSPGHSFESP